VNGRIEVTQDEIAEKIDELADLCDVWKKSRSLGLSPKHNRAAIVMTAQDIAALVRVQEAGR